MTNDNRVMLLEYLSKARTGVPVGKNPGRNGLLQEEVIYDVIGNHSIAGR